jgi:hypothetical protein
VELDRLGEAVRVSAGNILIRFKLPQNSGIEDLFRSENSGGHDASISK